MQRRMSLARSERWDFYGQAKQRGEVRRWSWPIKFSLHHGFLRRMKKDRPLVPRIIEGKRKLVFVGDEAEAALRIGMLKALGGGLGHGLGRAAGGKF